MGSEFSIKANCGFVIRGPLLSLQLVLDELQRFIASRPDVQIVYQLTSVNRVFVYSDAESRPGASKGQRGER